MPNEMANNDENLLGAEATPERITKGEAVEPQPSEIAEPERRRVHVTRGLVDLLLDVAKDVEPSPMNLVLAPTPADEFDDDLGLDPEAPVFTHSYMAEASRSVSAAFGMSLGTPAGHGRARSLTHPQGLFEFTERGGLAAVVLLAVPPWEWRTLAAFDRAGRKLELAIFDARPPQGEFD